MKGQTTDDPELQRFADVLHDEHERTMRIPVPPDVAGTGIVFHTTIMVHREHLPVPVLGVPFFPLLANPSVTQATCILPAREWPPELRSYWLELARR